MSVRQVNETFMVGTASSTVSNNGSTATATLQPQLSIPVTATSVTVNLRNAYIWNSFVNVSSEFGQLVRLTHGGNPFTTIKIPEGQYSVDTFNESFARESIAASAHWVTNGVCNLTFEADEAQQKIYILNKMTTEYEFDWDSAVPNTTLPTTWRLLGFTQGSKLLVPAAANTTTPSIHVYAPNRAQFNLVNQVVVSCNLVSRGIRDAGEYKSILAQVPITQPPGHLMVYEPDLPPITESGLVGASINTIAVTLKNEKGELIRTPGNDWFTTIDLSYDIID
jgi:hypothetical protein